MAANPQTGAHRDGLIETDPDVSIIPGWEQTECWRMLIGSKLYDASDSSFGDEV